MEQIQELASSCKVAGTYDKVYNEECVYSFANPYRDGGILVNLASFVGTAPNLAPPNGLFVRIEKKRVPKKEETDAKEAPTTLGMGVDGGFANPDDKFETEVTARVVVLKDGAVVAEEAYNDDTKASFPIMVSQSADSILNHAGNLLQQDVQTWQLDEDIPVSKYAADLPYVDNGITIDPNPKTWECQKSGDTENLWLNLSDGYIGGGRRNWDGSGGSNGALDHYEETGKLYPLVVKLGTISSDVEACDCYSYAGDQEGPVKIPNLAEMLQKRGIQIASLQKTTKSTAELEVELNANYAFDAITEASATLEPVSGPGLQGLQNLGNSCYMNSCLQVLASLAEVGKRYGGGVTNDVSSTQAPTDLTVQTTKVISALVSGDYVRPSTVEDESDPQYRLAPRMLKHLFHEHPDFGTGQQQDAGQFLQYLLELLDRQERKLKKEYPTSHLFGVQTVARLVCAADQAVKYRASATESIWSLPLPMDQAVFPPPEAKKLKSEKTDKEPLPTLTLEACLQAWAQETITEQLEWSHLQNQKQDARQTLRLANFPRYLLIQAQRYTLGDDWVPKKLEVSLQVEDELDLTWLKSTGPQEGETIVEDGKNEDKPAESSIALDEGALGQLMDMGFSLNACKRALIAVGGNNVEAAMGWVFEHNMDPDFNDPIDETGATAGSASSSSNVDETVVQGLVSSLGCFTADQVRAALGETNGAADRAADWLFSHMDDLDRAIAGLSKDAGGAGGSKLEPEDGPGLYHLTGMISHIGKNTNSGHYVAHIKKDGRWIIFNDEKVAVSANPPKEHAFIYLFQRRDTIGSAPHDGY